MVSAWWIILKTILLITERNAGCILVLKLLGKSGTARTQMMAPRLKFCFNALQKEEEVKKITTTKSARCFKKLLIEKDCQKSHC